MMAEKEYFAAYVLPLSVCELLVTITDKIKLNLTKSLYLSFPSAEYFLRSFSLRSWWPLFTAAIIKAHFVLTMKELDNMKETGSEWFGKNALSERKIKDESWAEAANKKRKGKLWPCPEGHQHELKLVYF